MNKFNGFLTGFGTMLLGVAAWMALCKTDGVLDKILQVQKAVGELEKGNKTLQDTSNEIKDGIRVIDQRLINLISAETLSKNTLRERQEALKKLGQSDILRPGDVYLPMNKLQEGEKLLQSNDLNMQRQFLNQNLQIWRPEKDELKASRR